MEVRTSRLMAPQPPFITCGGFGQTRRHRDVNDPVLHPTATPSANIIENCTLAAFVSAVVKDDYDRIVTGRPNEKLGAYHYTVAVQSCLAHNAEGKATSAYGSGSVHHVFDRMSEGKQIIE